MSSLLRRGVTLGITALALGTSVPAVPAAGAAPRGDAVIAEVYGGGGNSGATLTHDFVELGGTGIVQS